MINILHVYQTCRLGTLPPLDPKIHIQLYTNEKNLTILWLNFVDSLQGSRQ